MSGPAQAFLEAGVAAERAERQREEARRQKELDDARKLAEAGKLRAPVRLGEAFNVGLSATGIDAGRDAKQNREVNKLAFTPDSKTLLATWPVALSNGRIVDDQPKQFDVDPSSWIVRVCQIVGRNLTRV